MKVTEHQVAKLMEEDMGSAMQYLQGKGLCLMPISLATAISTSTTTNTRSHHPLLPSTNGAGGPTSPSLSVLSVQSATRGVNGVNNDNTSVSKPWNTSLTNPFQLSKRHTCTFLVSISLVNFGLLALLSYKLFIIMEFLSVCILGSFKDFQTLSLSY